MTTQGGPLKGALAGSMDMDDAAVKRKAKAKTERPAAVEVAATTRQNPDMSTSIGGANGHPPGFTWGNDHHR